MRFLLTGAFGYLGGRLAATLAREELTLCTRRAGQRAPWAPSARIVQQDWSDDAQLLSICEGMEVVFHLAGMNAEQCLRDPVAAIEFNAAGTARLVRASVAQRVRRFVYVSTAHVYGTALHGEVTELTCARPSHPYATSHRAAEDALRFAQDRGAIECVTVRLSNTFGPPVDPSSDCWSLLLNGLCREAVKEGCISLRTTGSQRRNFVALSEVCRALLHLASMPSSNIGDGVFNLGSEWSPSVLEAAQFAASRVTAATGSPVAIRTGRLNDATAAEALNFRITKLEGTGFALRAAAIQDELDALVTYCLQQRAQAG